jgi:curved DNA-binding protein
MANSPYDTLGIKPSATADEIKKAWREKAKEFHPDNGDGDEEKMKEVNLAYDTLKNPQKKAEFDNPSRGNFNPFGDGGPFAHARHSGMGDHVHQSENIHLPIGVSLKVMIFGGTITVPVQIPSIQRTPHGFVSMTMHVTNVTVTIDPKTPIGHQIIITPAQLNKNNVGNVVLQIFPETSSTNKFQTDGGNIIIPIEVNVFDAINGNKADIELPTGERVSVSLPKNTKPNQTIRITNKGLYVSKDTRADVFFIINITVPDLTDEQIEQINNIINPEPLVKS